MQVLLPQGFFTRCLHGARSISGLEAQGLLSIGTFAALFLVSFVHDAFGGQAFSSRKIKTCTCTRDILNEHCFNFLNACDDHDMENHFSLDGTASHVRDLSSFLQSCDQVQEGLNEKKPTGLKSSLAP
ncbi:hypothetical protein AVEN_134691-1 [Araneus ventricosus]|uniref:Uncharacterized protein n=1 Tax=Araneus ventricosus TaxID=182803 RepID=A0A4Y2HUS5_ARAVE|nr:hypothetical protein AVEN_134691-1 [Araneus ventricosus]